MVAAALVAVPMYFWSKLALYVVILCLLGLQISALTAGLREWHAKPDKVALTISAIGFLAAFSSVFMYAFRVLRISERGFVFGLCIPCAAMTVLAVIAGLAAVARKNDRTRGLRALLILWLGPAEICSALYLLMWLVAPAGSMYQVHGLTVAVTPAFALPFGPWATLAARFGNWPNAGEFFYLPLAVGLTVALAVIVAVALRAKDGRIAALSIVTSAPMFFCWFIVGFVQILNCAE
jgi:hypothetical protein